MSKLSEAEIAALKSCRVSVCGEYGCQVNVYFDRLENPSEDLRQFIEEAIQEKLGRAGVSI